jgi:hypothetical protein
MSKEEKKDSNDPVNNDGKSTDNPANKDNPNESENIKALQRKLTEKDKELKLLQEQQKNSESDQGEKNEATKLMEKILEENKNLSSKIDEINLDKKADLLKEKYPDIATDLIIHLDDDQIESVVEKQREISKKQYGDSEYFKSPQYTNISDIDSEIEKVKSDTSLSVEKKFEKVSELKSARDKL